MGYPKLASAAFVSAMLLMVSTVHAQSNGASTTQPAADGKAAVSWMEPIVRQGVLDAMAIPIIVDRQAAGGSDRTRALMNFVIADFNTRVGPGANGPDWSVLSYSMVAYKNSIHVSATSGTGAFHAPGSRSATYAISVLDNAEQITHALIQITLADKNGSFFAGEWDLEWTAAGWHRRASTLPTDASKPEDPVEVIAQSKPEK